MVYLKVPVDWAGFLVFKLLHIAMDGLRKGSV